jgi:hypothetical protein
LAVTENSGQPIIDFFASESQSDAILAASYPLFRSDTDDSLDFARHSNNLRLG